MEPRGGRPTLRPAGTLVNPHSNRPPRAKGTAAQLQRASSRRPDYHLMMFHVPLDIMMSCAVSLAAIVSPAGPARAPSAPAERIWIAGRYDRSRIVVYFATAHFHDSTPASARKIAPPKADGFFDPISLSRSDVERFRTDTAPQHFAVGDRYDLVLDN